LGISKEKYEVKVGSKEIDVVKETHDHEEIWEY
jgi:hypothetical protein